MSNDSSGGGGFSVVNLGDLSKPATVLIEKISNAIGVVYAPIQTVRMARAEADAAHIKAIAEYETLTEIERRTAARLVHEEVRKQQNIERITAQAIPDLTEEARPEALEPDWIAHFFDRCRLVSDEEMQRLWAKLLSGEANSPGSISRRTVEVVSTLDKSDAHLFTALCGFAGDTGGMQPFVFAVEHEIYLRNGLSFGILTHLDDLGLISFNSPLGYQRAGLPKRFAVPYFGQAVLFECTPESNNDLDLGKALLTRAGRDLAPLCGAKPVEGFLEYAMAHWRSATTQVRLASAL